MRVGPTAAKVDYGFGAIVIFDFQGDLSPGLHLIRFEVEVGRRRARLPLDDDSERRIWNASKMRREAVPEVTAIPEDELVEDAGLAEAA